MSVIVKTQGGGGGLFASIFVRGLSEGDVVTATKDGVTKEGKWTESVTEEIVPLIPVMTSNTAPSGTAGTTQGLSTQTYRAYMAFDGNTNTSADVYYGQNFLIGTKTYYLFNSAQKDIRKVSLCGHTDTGTMNTGVIEYTEDGTEWKTLVELNAENCEINGIDVNAELDVDVATLVGIRAGATATTSGRGLIVHELQVYGANTINNGGFLIPRINDLGMWTVTATNGRLTKTQDVLIDVVTRFEIKMILDYVLLDNDEGIDKIAGTYKVTNVRGAVSFAKQTDGSYLLSSSGGSVSGGTDYSVTMPIDFDDYENLYALVDASTTSGDSPNYVTMSVSTNNTSFENLGTTDNFGGYYNGDTATNEIVTTDGKLESALSDFNYFSMYGYTTGGIVKLTIKKLWLE